MGKTFRNNSDDAEYYKAQRLQRERNARRKKEKGRSSSFEGKDDNDSTPRPNKPRH